MVERIDQIWAEKAAGEKELDETQEHKRKYKTGCRVYDGFIEQLLEKIGRGFLQGTVSSYQQDQTERQQVEADQAVAEQKTVTQEFENKFTNLEMTQTCDKVKQIMSDQITELAETKAQQHANMLAYARDEIEMRKLAL